MKKNRIDWYKLDNAGKIYPSIAGTRVSTVFRISVTLKSKIDSGVLQQAFENIIERFPYFKVNLKRGIFWYYYEYSNTMPKVEEENFYPCMFLKYKSRDIFPFRILYFNKRISGEFSHSITDGTGASIFVTSLVNEYLRIKERIIIIPNEEFDVNSKINSEEWKDSFRRYYKKGIPQPESPQKAVQLPLKMVVKGEYLILSGMVSVTEIKNVAAKYSCSVTQYLLALYFETIQDFIKSMPEKKRGKYMGRIVINTPVNLRKIYPSKSMRNFFISLIPEIDLRLGDYTREEIIEYLKNYMKMNITEKNISRFISRNISNEKIIFLRLIPLFIKNLVLNQVYKKFGESGYTSSISNIGEIKFSEEASKYIEYVEFYPPPSRGNKIKAAVISFKDIMVISFGKLTKDTEIEKIFFRKLRKDGVRIKIHTNME